MNTEHIRTSILGRITLGENTFQVSPYLLEKCAVLAQEHNCFLPTLKLIILWRRLRLSFPFFRRSWVVSQSWGETPVAVHWGAARTDTINILSIVLEFALELCSAFTQTPFLSTSVNPKSFWKTPMHSLCYLCYGCWRKGCVAQRLQDSQPLEAVSRERTETPCKDKSDRSARWTLHSKRCVPPRPPLQHGNEQLLCSVQKLTLPQVLHQHQYHWYRQRTPSYVTRLGIQAMFSCSFLARDKIQAQTDAPLVSAWLQRVILISLIMRYPQVMIEAQLHFVKKWKKSLPIAALVKELAIMKYDNKEEKKVYRQLKMMVDSAKT